MSGPVRTPGTRAAPGHALVVALLGLTPTLLVPSVGRAQPFESTGARALGMAGAFVAVADDATAAYWNPAGLSTGAFFSLILDRSRTETRAGGAADQGPGADVTGSFVGLSTNSLALSYYRLRVNQIDRERSPDDPSDAPEPPRLTSLIVHNAAMTGAQLLGPGVSLGSTIRYVRASAGVGDGVAGMTTDRLLEDAADLERQGEHAFDWDLGLMAGGARLRVGVVARNLLEPTVEAPDGSVIRLDRQVRAGVALRPAGRWLVAADIDLSRRRSAAGDRRTVAVGAEHWVGDWLGVRGGIRFDVGQDDAMPVGAFGLSLALTTGMFVDGQVTRGRDDTARGWSLAGRIGF